MMIRRIDTSKPYYCQKGKCLVQKDPELGKSLLEQFVCPNIATRKRDEVLCSISAIEGTTKKMSICRVYETYKTGIAPSRKFIPKYSPFSKYGYLSILEPVGVDLL